MIWHCAQHRINLALRPVVMGIVNVTPDSFSDGGRHAKTEQAIAHGLALWAQGADILDIGGESTRPGAAPVAQDEELARVVPVVQALAQAGAVVSIDTLKPAVMRAALAAGACIVNDVNALQAQGALEAIAASDCGVVLMHMQGTPVTMQQAPAYKNEDALTQVQRELAALHERAVVGGIAANRIVIDPGIGFGKTLAHNLALVAGLASLSTIAPVLLGASRKKLLEHITGRPVEDRLAASLGMAVSGAQSGASVVRVHDVAQTVDALKIWRAIAEQQVAWQSLLE
jgi:dihydropteroate synthase